MDYEPEDAYDTDVYDACDAREDEAARNREKALAVARSLRSRAAKLVAHAERLERLAVTPEPFDRWTLAELLLDPGAEVAVKGEDGRYRFLDPAELELCGVRDLGDKDLLCKYIGSSADVTDRCNAETAWFLEEWGKLECLACPTAR